MSQHSMDDVVRNYARDVLGMQREDLNEFLWIADEAMRAPLPDGWEQHEDESRGKPYDLGVPSCRDAFTPSTRLVSISRCRGWFLCRF